MPPFTPLPGLPTYVPSIPLLPPTPFIRTAGFCLLFSRYGTNKTKLNCIAIDISYPTFLPAFPHPGFANQGFRQRYVTCGTMRALTPAILHLGLQVSPFTATHLPIVPPPTTWCVRTSLLPPRQCVRWLSGFTLTSGARQHIPPNQVRHPADRHFASGCFPPRLTTTQLPSTTVLWHTPTRTLTLLISRHPGRTTKPLRGSFFSEFTTSLRYEIYFLYCVIFNFF